MKSDEANSPEDVYEEVKDDDGISRGLYKFNIGSLDKESNEDIIKMKWITNYPLPLLAFLVKTKSIEAETGTVKTSYRLELVRFENKELGKIMTLNFDSKVTDYDCVNIEPSVLLLTVIEDGRLKAYSLGIKEAYEGKPDSVVMEPTFESAKHRNQYCLVRILPAAEKNMIVCSDFNCNIHVFKLTAETVDPFAKPSLVIFNSHAKLITDMLFLTIPIPSSDSPNHVESYQHYLASCSLDGYLKIWNFEDNFKPIYELFSSKKWLFGMSFDMTTLILYCNGEGKHFP